MKKIIAEDSGRYKLHLQGWLSRSDDNMLSLSSKEHRGLNWRIQEEISDYFECSKEYVNEDQDDHVGGEIGLLKDVSLAVYATDKECNLDDAVTAFVAMFDGIFFSDIGYKGYSMYSVTGLNCRSFTIGGHDLNQELAQYIGKFVHILVELNVM